MYKYKRFIIIISISSISIRPTDFRSCVCIPIPQGRFSCLQREIELLCYPDDDFIDGTLIDIKFAVV